jgi:acetyl esterase
MTTVDPQAGAMHEAMTAAPPFDQLGVQATRDIVANFAAPPAPVDGRLVVRDQLAGGTPVRVYRHVDRAVRPTIIFIHGGGWVFGDLDGADPICQALAVAGEVTVVSVGYRLSPEAQFPLPLDDCLTALRWVVEQAEDFDPARVCLAGESSGGQLAAATALRARDLDIPVAFQLLVNPVIDPSLSSLSWRELGDQWMPPRSQMSWMWDLYTGNSEVRERDPLVNLALEQDLSGLPPTLILTSEYDPLRDEGEQYGQRLAQAGVPTQVRRLAGQIHAVFGLIGAVDACLQALHDAVATVVKDIGARQRESAP